MTDRERQYAALGIEYAEGIDRYAADAPAGPILEVPTTGRTITKLSSGKFSCQPWNDNYYRDFDDLLDALKFASRPVTKRDQYGFPTGYAGDGQTASS